MPDNDRTQLRDDGTFTPAYGWEKRKNDKRPLDMAEIKRRLRETNHPDPAA